MLDTGSKLRLITLIFTYRTLSLNLIAKTLQEIEHEGLEKYVSAQRKEIMSELKVKSL